MQSGHVQLRRRYCWTQKHIWYCQSGAALVLTRRLPLLPLHLYEVNLVTRALNRALLVLRLLNGLTAALFTPFLPVSQAGVWRL